MSYKISFFTLIILIFSPFQGWAQNCEAHYEQIVEMKRPKIGSYNVWDTIYGKQDLQEKFKTGLVIKNRNMVVAGERFSYEEGPVTLILAEIDRRGRPVWEASHEIEALRNVKKIERHEKGYIVLGNIGTKKSSKLWLGFFDEKGVLVSQKVLSEKGHALLGEDILPFPGRDDFLIALSLSKLGEKNTYGALYQIDKSGEIITQRSYFSGLENKILGLSNNGDDYFMASGYIRGEDGRKNGWILRLRHDLSLEWQRQYPRGRSAILHIANDYIYNYTAVLGEALPLGGGKQAGWLMLINKSTGDPVWQRYYSSELHQYGSGLLTSNDGLISVLLSARKFDKKEGDEYVRLLTINPRGILFSSNEFFNGKGVRAYQMLLGPNKERLLIGVTDMIYKIEGPEPDSFEPKKSQEGWIVAATATELYNDPCKSPYVFLP